MTSEEMKSAIKQALKEWLDERWTHYTSRLGTWMIGLIAAAALAAIGWMILTANGWKHP